MKLKKLSNLMVLGLALTITAVGCQGPKPKNSRVIPGSKPPIVDNNLPPGNTMQPPQNPNDVNRNNTGIPPGPGHPGWNANPLPLKADTINFEFDKSTIKSSEQGKLEEVANYLKGNPAAAVKVEGNCDERGTEEYNRSLGERRALAAREYLVHLGIEPERIDTISFGEDHPVETAHNEAAWSKNRRDDFEVLTPPGQ